MRRSAIEVATSFVSNKTVLLAGLVALAVACTTDYQENLYDVPYNWTGLQGSEQPGASSSTGKNENDARPECVRAGGTLLSADDTKTCTVSFAKDVLPSLGKGNCQQIGCHGGDTPPNQPSIDVDAAKAAATWAEFAGFKLSNGKPYINPCSKDPTQSAVACNVNAQTTCGALMPPTGGLAAGDVTKLEEWAKCGAPNN